MQDRVAVYYFVRSKAAVHRKLKLVTSRRKVGPVVRALTNLSSSPGSITNFSLNLGNVVKSKSQNILSLAGPPCEFGHLGSHSWLILVHAMPLCYSAVSSGRSLYFLHHFQACDPSLLRAYL